MLLSSPVRGSQPSCPTRRYHDSTHVASENQYMRVWLPCVTGYSRVIFLIICVYSFLYPIFKNFSRDYFVDIFNMREF